MVNCDYCGKKIERHIFCSASCKVRFHRGDKVKTVIPQALNTKEEVKKVISPDEFKKVIDPIVVQEQPQFSDIKKEGYHYSEMLGKYVKD